MDRQWFDRDLLTLEGRPLSLHWYDGEALWVAPYRGPDAADQLLSYELAQELPVQFGLERSLGAYHHLLPVELRLSAVVAQFDIPRFVAAVIALHSERAPTALAQDLIDLLPQGIGADLGV